MTLDRELVKKACIELWNQYHSKIEEMGYSLDKCSMMSEFKGISLIATIKPNYSKDIERKLMEIIPKEFEYAGEKIPVIILPSLNDAFGKK
jgi:hypothetical protein